MDARPHAALDRLLRDMIAAGEFPGAAYVVGTAAGPVWAGAVGRLASEPDEALPPDPVYDLASLTKPLAAGAVALRLAALGRLDLDRPLRDHLPDWGDDDRSDLTCRDLLLHRSGLPAWEPLYLRCPDPEEVPGYLGRRPLACEPRSRSVYSCLGFILLGKVLEAAGGAPLDRLFLEQVAAPLGLGSARFRPPPAWLSRTAPTERGNLRERELAGPEGDSDPGWPEGVLRGEVHDRNARHLGAVAGNSGLFATAGDVERMTRAFLVPGLLDEPARLAAARPDGPREPEVRTLAFQSAQSPDSAAGAGLSGSAFGHTGFTGTSTFVDPAAGRTFVLLTNRVHPRWKPGSMNLLRRAFHRAAVSALEERGL